MCNLDEPLTMTELEQVRLCAKAMGIKILEAGENEPQRTIRIMNTVNNPFFKHPNEPFWPITNDYQAMVMAKYFMLHLDMLAGMAELPFPRTSDLGNESKFTSFNDDSINKAIVECIAEMQLHSPVKPEEIGTIADEALSKAIDIAATGRFKIK